MLEILILLTACLGSLVIWSPDELASLDIQIVVAEFGEGSLLPIIGKLFFVQSSGSCTFSTPMPHNAFSILYGFTNSSNTDLALSVQSSGGSMMIEVVPGNTMNFVMTAEDESLAKSITITCIAISQDIGGQIQKYSSKEIWASYSYDYSRGSSNLIDFQMSSNYTNDLQFISVFSNISTRL